MNLLILLNDKTDFCSQNINTTGKYFTAEYEATPSNPGTTATLRCIEGYTLVTAGSAVCGSYGQWIIEYPDCRGIFMHCIIVNWAYIAPYISCLLPSNVDISW